MLSREDNELLTRTGDGTPMGDFMRRFWMPVMLADELTEPDGAPVRVRLLGEDLIAFRDTEGRIGLVDRYCPHRRANLFFGRNEECGIRCVYHGWKFDVDGNCTELPSEPPDSSFREKVRLTAYPTAIRGGVLWTYMGPADKQGEVPHFDWMDLDNNNGRLIVDMRYSQIPNAIKGLWGIELRPNAATTDHVDWRAQRSTGRQVLTTFSDQLLGHGAQALPGH